MTQCPAPAVPVLTIHFGPRPYCSRCQVETAQMAAERQITPEFAAMAQKIMDANDELFRRLAQ